MKDYRQEDRRHRERLEKQSISEGRADVAGALNRLASGDAQGMPGVAAYLLLQAAQRTHGRHIAKLNKAHDRAMAAGKFNRLHPNSELARRLVPASPTSDIPISEQDDARRDRIGPNLRDYVPVRDASGGMDSDAQTRRELFSGQGGRELGVGQMAETLRLTVEQMRALAVAQVVASRYF
jgi:hypothetical protein